jgi:uncharacterized protein DUF6788
MAGRGPRSDLLMLRGVLFTLVRRCGKPSCHCASEAGHESPALAYPVGGRTKTMTLAASDVDEVRAALDRYNAARATLDAQADAGVTALRARLAERRQPRSR